MLEVVHFFPSQTVHAHSHLTLTNQHAYTAMFAEMEMQQMLQVCGSFTLVDRFPAYTSFVLQYLYLQTEFQRGCKRLDIQ